MKFKSPMLILPAILAIFLLTPVFLVVAASPDIGLNYANELGLPTTDKSPWELIINVVKYFLTFVGLIAVIMIIYAGWLWTTSAGNEDRIRRAKKTLFNAVIGLIIVIFSFAIVTYITNLITKGIPGGGPGTGTPDTLRGLAAIGNCAIESVYPEPDQKDVARNTSIIVTFKEEVNPATVISGTQIIKENIRIYKNTDDPDNPDNYLSAVTATTPDNLTFIFTPTNYLGSPSEIIWYTVYLTNDILRSDGQGIFRNCRSDFFEWQFEVSNRLDLEPPQVKANGVFPPPDNDVDTYTTTAAVQATGVITVNSQPRFYAPATVGDPAPNGGPSDPAPDASVVPLSINTNHTQSGILLLAFTSDTTAVLSDASGRLLGSASAENGQVAFSNFFTLVLDDPSVNFDTGQSWDIPVTPVQVSDRLTVGSINYTFVNSAPGTNQIRLGADPAGTAANIATVLNVPSSLLNATVADNRVNLTAKTAGASGNAIVLSASNPASLAIAPMSGGVDGGETATVNGLRDQPRNAVIQINFNEAVNPSMVSGNAADISAYIRVVNLSTGDNLPGKFVISNQYRTVEFISDSLCGTNSCGEQIYCLPADSHLAVLLNAAALDGCTNCAGRSPFTACAGGHCQNPATGEFYPLAASPLDGLVDLALNSLNGNRVNGAEGPTSFYDENSSNPAEGDNYRWSFYIGRTIDLNAPVIDALSPSHSGTDALLSDPVRIDFNKLMLSSSLKTGATRMTNGRDSAINKNINIWNFTGAGIGYWLAKNDIDNSSPADGYPDYTQAEIRHTTFADTTSYRAQVGSAVKDIYQNCFKPVSGPGCDGTASEQSCCPIPSGYDQVEVAPGANCP